MIRDTVILVVVLLVLITIVSAFGGSMRHTPSMSAEGFYGLDMEGEEGEEAEMGEENFAEEGEEAEMGEGGEVEAEGTDLPLTEEEEESNAEAVAKAAMGAAGLNMDAEPEMPAGDSELAGGSGSSGKVPIEAFQSAGFASW